MVNNAGQRRVFKLCLSYSAVHVECKRTWWSPSNVIPRAWISSKCVLASGQFSDAVQGSKPEYCMVLAWILAIPSVKQHLAPSTLAKLVEGGRMHYCSSTSGDPKILLQPDLPICFMKDIEESTYLEMTSVAAFTDRIIFRWYSLCYLLRVYQRLCVSQRSKVKLAQSFIPWFGPQEI